MRNFLVLATCFVSIYAFGQSYYYQPSVTRGNPGGLNADNEYPSGSGLPAGWTQIHAGGSATPTWSSTENIPFTFSFAGSPVTSYKVSSSGVLTFTVAAISVPGAINSTLPSGAIPDKSVAIWGLLGSGSNDKIVTKTFGNAPNRQHWVFFSSYSTNAGSCWTYWSIVLEETTNDIYVIDQRNNCASEDLTIGIQVNAGTGIQVLGSPTLAGLASGNPGPADNSFYRFIYGTQPAFDIAGMEVSLYPYQNLSTAPFTVTGSVINFGTNAVTGFDLNYSINGGTVFTNTISGLSLATYVSTDVATTTTWTPPSTGTYTVEIWADNINGVNADADTTNDVAIKSVSIYNNLTDRKSLLETFISSTSNASATGNTNLAGLLTGTMASDIISVKYHMDWPSPGDPYFTQDAEDRKSYYYVSFVPRSFVDGGYDQNTSSLTTNIFEEYLAHKSFCELSAALIIENSKVTVNVDIDPVESFNNNNLRLYTAVFEYTTSFNASTNGETEFHNVMKKMLPGSNGQAISALVAGVPQNKSHSYTFEGDYRLPTGASDSIQHAIEHSVEEFSDLGVAVWIQDNSTGRVIQAVYGEVFNYVGLVENREFLSTAKVYPNPVSDIAIVAINTMQPGSASYELYNILGDLVASASLGTLNSGRNLVTVDMSNQAPGMYLLHLVSGTERIVKKVDLIH